MVQMWSLNEIAGTCWWISGLHQLLAVGFLPEELIVFTHLRLFETVTSASLSCHLCCYCCLFLSGNMHLWRQMQLLPWPGVATWGENGMMFFCFFYKRFYFWTLNGRLDRMKMMHCNRIAFGWGQKPKNCCRMQNISIIQFHVSFFVWDCFYVTVSVQ